MPCKLINRLDRIDGLIRQKRTGTPEELSKKVRVSKRHIYNYIQILKEMGAPIGFCRKSKTYYYKMAGSFSFRFENID